VTSNKNSVCTFSTYVVPSRLEWFKSID